MPGGRAACLPSLLPLVALLVALVLWSLMWAGALGLVIRRRGWTADPRLLLLVGICVGAVGAVVVFSYPGLSQVYYLKAATGAFGILTAVGIAAVVPVRRSYGSLVGAVVVAALVGAVAVLAIDALGPSKVPSLARDHLSGVLPGILLPVVALLIVVALAYVVLRWAEPRWPVLLGAVPLLVIAVAMGFSIPNLPTGIVSQTFNPSAEVTVAAEGIDAARWLRDHSDPNDLVATNLHCWPLPNSRRCVRRAAFLGVRLLGAADAGRRLGIHVQGDRGRHEARRQRSDGAVLGSGAPGRQ